MSNGVYTSAEVDAILSGGQVEVNTFLVKTVIELKHGQAEMKRICEDRPGECLLAHRADRSSNPSHAVWLITAAGTRFTNLIFALMGSVVTVIISELLFHKP